MYSLLKTVSVVVLLAGMLSATSAAAPAPGPGSRIDRCPLFPVNNAWNMPVDGLPVDSNSTDYINTIGASTGLHPDFGSGQWNGGDIGIPYNIVPGSQTGYTVAFSYDPESDHVRYPIPLGYKIEYGSDHHILMIDRDNCRLYELFNASYSPASGWHAGSGAVFDLGSNRLRPDTWTSADAAGLPILPGLARYEEVNAGAINHALRFTADLTRKAHIWPARHDASDLTGSEYPPMGQRFRLKSSYTIPANFSPQTKIILTALKKYGLILADNGSNWYISGSPNPGWDDDRLVNELSQVFGSNFEAVDTSGLAISSDSAAFYPDFRLFTPLIRR
jgi:hypothetical protein